MATATIYSSAPVPLYDIYRDDPSNHNYEVPINDQFEMSFEELYSSQSLNEVQAYSFPQQTTYSQVPQMGLARPFPKYNGGMATFQPFTGVPQVSFQTPPPLTAASSFASSSSSLQYPLTPPPAPVCKEVQKANAKTKLNGKRATRNVTQVAKRGLLSSKPKKKRGPNKRPPGTAFSNLLDVLPKAVREALEQDYKGCCDVVNTTDASTKQKHMFSNRHCKNIPEVYQELVPNFVCPAFVALKSNCRSKAGRYDSTDRHCRNCEGFSEINQGNKRAFPVVITRAQYMGLHKYRTACAARSNGGKQPTEQPTEPVDIRTILRDMFKDGLPDWLPVVDLDGDSGVNDSLRLAPTHTTPVLAPIANHPEQSPLPELSPFDCAEDQRDFILKRQHEEISNELDAILNDPAQPPTTGMSASDCVTNHLEQLLAYEPSPFYAEAETFKNVFPAVSDEVVSNDSGPITDGTTQLSTVSTSDPVANPSEQPLDSQPLLLDLGGVDWPFDLSFC